MLYFILRNWDAGNRSNQYDRKEHHYEQKFHRKNVMHTCGRNSQFDSLGPSICYAKY